jgi:hypothetical protein
MPTARLAMASEASCRQADSARGEPTSDSELRPSITAAARTPQQIELAPVPLASRAELDANARSAHPCSRESRLVAGAFG